MSCSNSSHKSNREAALSLIFHEIAQRFATIPAEVIYGPQQRSRRKPLELEHVNTCQQSAHIMQIVSAYTPLTGPSSDPVLYGVATALSQLFPLITHPSSFQENEVSTDEEDEDDEQGSR